MKFPLHLTADELAYLATVIPPENDPYRLRGLLRNILAEVRQHTDRLAETTARVRATAHFEPERGTVTKRVSKNTTPKMEKARRVVEAMCPADRERVLRELRGLRR